MSLATILAVVDGAPGSEAALEAALTVGRDFSAHVEVLHVQVDAEGSVPVVGEGMSGAAVEQILQSLKAEAEKRAKEAERLFEKHCTGAGLAVVDPDAELEPGKLTVAFRRAVGREADEVLRRSRLADLTVMARPAEDTEGGLSPAFDAALFDSGRPVILVPPEPVGTFGATVAVAWDRSRESARAVGAALPFLAKAEKAIILTAREAGVDAEPSELVRYLAGHGIAARTWAFTPGSGSIGDALLEEAQKAKADLLVMGAYGHSRLRELVLGGATRGVLTRGAIAVLMVH